jgi:N-acylneuraminate cytidylyltransferase
LAVIPARGGSKRVPGKNYREFAGRPLIAYTIEAALQSNVFEAVVVSTDDNNIAEIARQCGAQVPFMRNAELANDWTVSSAVTADTLERIDASGECYTCVAQLLPTCPLRNAKDVQDSFHQFVATEATAQISVTRFGWLNPWWAHKREHVHLTPVFPEAITQRSQDLPPLFVPVGAIWWASAAGLRESRSFYLPGYTGWELEWDRAIDVDTEEDWRMAEFLHQWQLQRGAAT